MSSRAAATYRKAMSTFLDVVELLLTDGDAKAAYSADPGGFMNEHGLGALDSADVADAMLFATDSLPLSVATQLDPEAGLDSAAALDLDAAGLSLEREAFDEPLDGDAADSDLRDDVDFDTPDGTDVDAVDLLDSPDGGGPVGGGAAGATEPIEEPVAETAVSAEVDDLNGDIQTLEIDAEFETEPGDDLTDFVPAEDAILETPDIRLDAGNDDLDEAAELEAIDTDDLDFLD